MATAAQRPKLVAIVGPTASGKSALALKIAKKYSGEIIAADSRTIYKGLDIGTAKPTKSEQKQVKHWGLDLIRPGEPFSAYQFQQYAQEAIKDIQNRKKLPILVGGTGLYVDSLLFDFGFQSPPDLWERKKLGGMSTQRLQEVIRQKKYEMPENLLNRRHLIRTIERKGQTGTRGKSLPGEVLLVGLLPLDEILKQRISKRIEKNFDGIIREMTKLLEKYGQQAIETNTGIAYKIIPRLLRGEITRKEAKGLIQKAEWQYARRQKTWFKRNKYINWFTNTEQAYNFVTSRLG